MIKTQAGSLEQTVKSVGTKKTNRHCNYYIGLSLKFIVWNVSKCDKTLAYSSLGTWLMLFRPNEYHCRRLDDLKRVTSIKLFETSQIIGNI